MLVNIYKKNNTFNSIFFF